MKINARLLLLTFTIVVLISVSSAIAYFSLTNKLITNQNNQSVLNSTNDFIFSFQELNEAIVLDFRQLLNDYSILEEAELDRYNLDFVFTLKNETDIDFSNFKATDKLNIKNSFLSVSQFLKDNPNVILKYKTINDEVYYFGKVITTDLLNTISEKIRAEIILVIDDVPSEFSTEDVQQTFLPVIFNAINGLKSRNQFDIYTDTYDNSDIYVSLYTPANVFASDSKISFLIFQSSAQAVEFRYTTGVIAVILIFSGIGLSLILVLLFTSKLRQQISDLSYAVKVTSKGNLNYRVKVTSKDELGNFGHAFNRMLDELQKQKNVEKDYSEFITLINRNPSLQEIAEAAVHKIIKSTDVSFGILYEVENDEILKPIASYGIQKSISSDQDKIDYYKNAIENREIIEFNFSENYPVLKTGLTEIKIKYVLIAPMIYAGQVVAIIELASEHKPEKDVKSYILNIREQLAMGIINGASFEKLSRLVSELKKLNDDYQTQNRELRNLHIELKQKAEELDEQRLKALEATKLKSQFLANMTHELKTPLNSILGLSDLIQNDESVSPANRNRLKVILRSGKRLLNLINNILEFSRAEAGKINVKAEQFSLGHFIDEIAAYIEPAAEEKGLNFIVEHDESLSVILVTDKEKLEQIIINLLNNAVKFTETGFIKLQISYPGNEDIKFDVIDTGIGISDENKAIIFEEFRQADGTTSRQYDGTGLGLSICKRFVELLHGKIELESEIEEGSKFSVSFSGIVKEKISPKNSAEQTENQYNILLVSPHGTAHKLYGDYFKLNNVASQSAYNCTEAKTFLNEQFINVVIINNHLEEKSGWEFLIELKEGGFKHPIIIKTLDSNNNYGYALDVRTYITSKFDPDEIKDIFNELHITAAKAFSLSRSQELNSFLQEEYDCSIPARDRSFEKILTMLNDNKPDILFADLLDSEIDTLKLIDSLKHNRVTRSIAVIILLPDKLNKDQAAMLNREMDEMLTKHKHHTLDVLKIFRKRLGFHENEKLKSRLLKEEKSEEIEFNVGQTENGLEKDAKKNKVLVVDDDSDTLFTVGEIIKNLGYETVFAKNGVECLLTLNHLKPDLILLDIMMPKMDGFETIKEIKRLENRKDVPVVALTAYAMLDDKDIIQRNGFNDIITKPVNTAELSIKIRKVLGE